MIDYMNNDRILCLQVLTPHLPPDPIFKQRKPAIKTTWHRVTIIRNDLVTQIKEGC